MTLDRVILWTLAIFAGFFALLLVASAAQALEWKSMAALCGDRAELVAEAENKHKERQTGVGVINSTALVELFRSADGGFTVFVSGVDGTACVVAVGADWQEIPKPKLKPEDSM